MTEPRPDDALVAELFGRLEHDVDAIVETIVVALRRDVAFYSQIPHDVLAVGVRGDAAAAISGVGRGQVSGDAELDTAAEVGAERAEQGVPMEALLQAFRVGGAGIVAHARKHARELELSAEGLLDLAERAWAWLDTVSIRAAQGHREAERTQLRADVHRRAAFLHAALHGSLPLSDLHAQAAVIGLDGAVRFSAVRARPTPDAPAHRLQALLAERGGGARELVGIVDGDVAGVVTKRPELPPSVAAGIGPAVALERIAESYASASEALSAAIAFERTGIYEMEALALETAVLDDRIGGALERRCLATLDALGEKGETIEETLRVFLAAGKRFEQAAGELSVHPNTLRHRIARYEELTGLDLHRTADLVATWTAIQHRQVRLGKGL